MSFRRFSAPTFFSSSKRSLQGDSGSVRSRASTTYIRKLSSDSSRVGIPMGSDSVTEQGPQIEIQTTRRELSKVLGRVVDVVVNSGGQDLDISTLENMNLKGLDDGTERIVLTYDELNEIVQRVVLSTSEAVKKGTKVPTGMSVENFGQKRCVVDLKWSRSRRKANKGK